MASIENIARPVGPQAKYNTARHSLGILRAVIVTCRYRIPVISLRQRSLSIQDVIENALATVVLGQPMLRVGIAGEDTKDPAFVHVKAIDMRGMIEWKALGTPASITSGTRQSEESRSEYGRKEQSQYNDEAGYEAGLLRSLEKHHEHLWEDLAVKPGWKIVVHHDPRQLGSLQPREPSHLGQAEEKADALLSLDISFCFHHAYADGRSGYAFHADLQRALNNGTRPPELQDHILYFAKPSTLPPGMETLIPFSVSWSFIMQTVWTQLLYPIIVSSFLGRLLRLETTQADIPWTGAPVDGSNPRAHIRMMFKLDDESRLKAILTQCRSHGTSLTGLLHALIARSLARRERGKSFRSVTPISLAGYADPGVAGPGFTPGATIHCLVTALTCDHDVGTVRRFDRDQVAEEAGISEDAAVWAFARDMTARLRAKAASLPRDDVLALSGLVGDWHEFFRSKFGKARDGSWELSNLGRLSAVDAGSYDNPELGNGMEEGKDGLWFIDRAVFTQGANATGAAFNVNVSGVAGRDVCATISWQDGIVNADLVEAVVSDLQAWIAELGEAGRSSD
ncbi:hypothetical protein F4861DRAFT_499799 [Xylaria intraflava]|nr:hypothetical protein F4861DRAFT_499799 [Xylaria intraflava]